MKLRNKKTGMIGEVGYLSDFNGEIIVNNINDQDEWFTYKSLAELNEEWEDVEEPKEKHWYMSSWGEVWQYGDDPLHEEWRRLLGNDFETKEEAEKAVEKLKAWKRLKDARLKFTDFGYNLDETSSNLISADGKICFELMCYEDFEDDLELLFGGEE